MGSGRYGLVTPESAVSWTAAVPARYAIHDGTAVIVASMATASENRRPRGPAGSAAGPPCGPGGDSRRRDGLGSVPGGIRVLLW